jgi:hypothetical protein
LVDLAAFALLRRGDPENLNVQGAFIQPATGERLTHEPMRRAGP